MSVRLSEGAIAVRAPRPVVPRDWWGGLGWERRELGTEFGPVLRGETRPGAGPGPGGQGGPWSGPAVTAVQR